MDGCIPFKRKQYLASFPFPIMWPPLCYKDRCIAVMIWGDAFTNVTSIRTSETFSEVEVPAPAADICEQSQPMSVSLSVCLELVHISHDLFRVVRHLSVNWISLTCCFALPSIIPGAHAVLSYCAHWTWLLICFKYTCSLKITVSQCVTIIFMLHKLTLEMQSWKISKTN